MKVMLRVGDLDRSIKFYTGGLLALAVVWVAVVGGRSCFCGLPSRLCRVLPGNCVDPWPSRSGRAAAGHAAARTRDNPLAGHTAVLGRAVPHLLLSHSLAEVLGMKLLRTRDNPEYKYTLAFLGG